MHHALAIVTALSVVACAPAAEPAPSIRIDACADGGIASCALSFGRPDIGADVERRAVLTNDSPLDLTLFDVALVGDPAFRIESVPDVVGAGESAELVIVARPNAETALAATVFVLSDAQNTPQTDEGRSLIPIALAVAGVDNGVPDIEVNPGDLEAECAFGAVRVGQEATCDLDVANVGTRDLFVDGVSLDDACGASCAFTVDSVVAGIVVPPAASAGVRVRFTPATTGAFTGTLSIATNDPDESPRAVSLLGEGVP